MEVHPVGSLLNSTDGHSRAEAADSNATKRHPRYRERLERAIENSGGHVEVHGE